MEFRVLPYVTVMKGGAPRLNVKRVVVHAGVTEIAENSFWGWTNLEEVVFEPNSRLEKIGDHAFAGTALKEFTAPGSLQMIGAGAFMGCKSLKTVTLNEGLEGIGDSAFKSSGLETIYLPSTLRRLCKATFSDCKCLKKVRVARGCKVKRDCIRLKVKVETVSPSTPDAKEESSSV